jgi:hypothetical protein
MQRVSDSANIATPTARNERSEPSSRETVTARASVSPGESLANSVVEKPEIVSEPETLPLYVRHLLQRLVDIQQVGPSANTKLFLSGSTAK